MNPNKNTGERVLLRFRTAFLFVAAAVLVAGCNSGGGGTSATTPATGTSTPTAATITQKNDSQAAGAAYQFVDMANSAGSAGISAATGAVVRSGAGWPGLARFAIQQFTMLTSPNSPVASILASVVPGSIPCGIPSSLGGAGKGSMFIKFNGAVSSSPTPRPGDTISVTYSNCSFKGETTTNGEFSLTFVTSEGIPIISGTPWKMSAIFSFKDLRIAEASGTTYIRNGEFLFSANGSGGGVTVKYSFMSVKGKSISTQRVSPPLTLTNSNFTIDGTVDHNTNVYSAYGSGKVIDSGLVDYVNFKIPKSTPFTGPLSGKYPTGGSMTVTGANGSSVKLTVYDSTHVQLLLTPSSLTGIVPWSSIIP